MLFYAIAPHLYVKCIMAFVFRLMYVLVFIDYFYGFHIIDVC